MLAICKTVLLAAALLLFVLTLWLRHLTTLSTPSETGKLILKRLVEPHSFPFVVHLNVINTDGTKGYCAGSIIAPYYILTAAHCLNGTASATVLAAVDDAFADQEEGRVAIISSDFIIHPQYNGSDHRLGFDLGLVRLARPLAFNQKVQAVEMAEIFQVGKMVVLGRGYFDWEGFGRRRVLRAAPVDVRSQADDHSEVCTEGPENEFSIIMGDSGGPLISPGRQLMGVVRGARCYEGAVRQECFTPMSQTNVEWIKQNSGIL